jgi:hypothetical protein
VAIKEIGCCGAYCKTCMEQQKAKYPNERTCLGCKLGYESGERDLSKAKCKIKVCCFRERTLETCVDCPDYPCEILGEFWNKKGWKYNQYKSSLNSSGKTGTTNFWQEQMNGKDHAES